MKYSIVSAIIFSIIFISEINIVKSQNNNTACSTTTISLENIEIDNNGYSSVNFLYTGPLIISQNNVACINLLEPNNQTIIDTIYITTEQSEFIYDGISNELIKYDKFKNGVKFL